VKFKIHRYLDKLKKWVLLFQEAAKHLLKLAHLNISRLRSSKRIQQFRHKIDSITSTEQIWLMGSINKLWKDTMSCKAIPTAMVPLWLVLTFICRNPKEILRHLQMKSSQTSIAVIMKNKKVNYLYQWCTISQHKGQFTIWIQEFSNQDRMMITLNLFQQRMSQHIRHQ